jgi:U3 small nucleolar RNA-associated protein 13
VRDSKNVAVGTGHTDSVGSVCLSKRAGDWSTTSRGAYGVSGAGDKILKRWSVPIAVLDSIADDDSSSAFKLGCTHSVRAHDKDINTIAISPNDALVASGSQDKSIKLWKSSNLSTVATLSGHKRGVWRVLFSPVDRSLASCSGDRTVKLWSVVDYTCLRTFEGHTGSVLSLKFVNRGMQLISGSADGLIRLWTIRTGECEKVLDGHTDKVWALSLPPLSLLQSSVGGSAQADSIATASSQDDVLTDAPLEASVDSNASADSSERLTFFSGGSDSRLNIWVDITAEEEEGRMQTLEKELLLEQELQNDVRQKRYDRALSIALRIGHPNKVLSILQSIIEDDSSNSPGGPQPIFPTVSNPLTSRSHSQKLSIAERLDTYVRKWKDEEIEKVFMLLKDWNTNAKNSYISTLLLNSLLRAVGVHRLASMKSVAVTLPGLIAYTERHYQRASKLLQSTYVVDYFASIMNWVPDDKEDDENVVRGEQKQNSLAVDSTSKKRPSSQMNSKKPARVPVLFGASTGPAAGGDDDEVDAEGTGSRPKKSKKAKKEAA